MRNQNQLAVTLRILVIVTVVLCISEVTLFRSRTINSWTSNIQKVLNPNSPQGQVALQPHQEELVLWSLFTHRKFPIDQGKDFQLGTAPISRQINTPWAKIHPRENPPCLSPNTPGPEILIEICNTINYSLPAFSALPPYPLAGNGLPASPFSL